MKKLTGDWLIGKKVRLINPYTDWHELGSICTILSYDYEDDIYYVKDNKNMVWFYKINDFDPIEDNKPIKRDLDKTNNNYIDWIFVKDRMPTKEENGLNVLVFDQKEGVHEAEYHGSTFNYPYYGQDMGGSFNNVIAWSVLPFPPSVD